MPKQIALCLLTLLLPHVAFADTATMSVEEIRTCIEKSGPKKSSVQTATLRTLDEEGGGTESEAKLYWKRFEDDLSRAMIRFTDPPDLRDSALLVLERKGGDNEIFMYLPELRTVRRVTTGMMSGSMFGTDFTYEEFERLYRIADDLESRRVEDGTVADKAVFVIEGKPKTEEDSAYQRIVQYVEQERCVPIQTEFFGSGAEPQKVLSVDPGALRAYEGAWLPNQIVMKDLEKGTRTTLDVTKIEVDVDIPDRIFSQKGLSRGR